MKYLIFICCFPIFCHAQYDNEKIFKDLEGEALREAIVDNYKTSIVLTLSQCRDTLYKIVYQENDSVSCVYSGLTKYLDPDSDPSQFLFGNGTNTDINLEHSYPRSKGASIGNAISDMHHLFPTRVSVNSARASDPFREINDNETDNWYYQDETLTSIPTNNRDKYSEDTDLGFEPREDFKGNIARAQFYFYTMYRNEADSEDPNFFDQQVSTLCEWHFNDPVDSLEWIRNQRIAFYQDGKENPFVLDCSLARLYCPEVSFPCLLVNTETPHSLEVRIIPNVVERGTSMTIQNPTQQRLKVSIFNLSGQLTSQSEIKSASTFEIASPNQAGIYYALINGQKDYTIEKIVVH